MNSTYKSTLQRIAFIAVLCLSILQVPAQRLAYVPQERTTMLQHIIDTQPVLSELIVKAGLAPTLSGDGPYTFLVPPDAELNSLKNESAQRVRTILSGHIIKGRYMEADLKDGATLETLAGTRLTVCRKKDHTLVSGARIMAANTEVKNGAIHKVSGTIKL